LGRSGGKPGRGAAALFLFFFTSGGRDCFSLEKAFAGLEKAQKTRGWVEETGPAGGGGKPKQLFFCDPNGAVF